MKAYSRLEVLAPVNSQDAVNKEYVDTQSSGGGGPTPAGPLPGVRVHRDSMQSITPYGDYVVFNQIDWDTTDGNMFDPNEPTELVAPEDGWYLIQGSFMMWGNSSFAAEFGVVLIINDEYDADFGGRELTGPVAEVYKLSATVPLYQGDKVTVYALNASDTTNVILEYAPTMPMLQMTKIGEHTL